MNAVLAFIAVGGLFLVAFAAAHAAFVRRVLEVALPAGAALAMLAGFSYRVLRWARSPVPFRIPLTAGQQASLSWIRRSRVDNPSTARGAILRMALEVALFRSLLRNVAVERHARGRLVFRDALGLWLGALAFHYALLVVLLRHLRFVLQPVPASITGLAALDGFFQLGVPPVYLSDVVLIAALAYLLVRRVVRPQLRYLSLFTDYALPALLLAIAVTGVVMRHAVRVDTIAVKEFALGLVTLSPGPAPRLHPLVLAHLAMVCTLVALLPFSKLMHMVGVFLSPTRNLANNSRARRHLNPWNGPVEVHTYAAWESEFRDKMVAAGLPLEDAAGNSADV
jgi:nitrate reductase gamma subunit